VEDKLTGLNTRNEELAQKQTQFVNGLYARDAGVRARIPAIPLTDGARVTASSFHQGTNQSQDGFLAFDGETTGSVEGWLAGRGDPSVLTVDNVPVSGRFVFLDMLESRVLTHCQIYARVSRWPTAFHIICSDDGETWSSVYYTESQAVDNTNESDDVPRKNAMGHTNRIEVTKKRFCKFAGILVTANEQPGRYNQTAIKQLFLWSDLSVRGEMEAMREDIIELQNRMAS
jgi:hypothetical protein